MKVRAGVLLEESRVALVVVSPRGEVECLAFEPSEDLGTLVAAELDSRGYTRRRLRMGLDRGLAVVKVLELPRTAGGDMGQMVRFELERHVAFPPEDMACLPRRIQPTRCVWAHRHDGRTDLVFIGRGAVRLSRSIPAETPEELVREIQRTLALLQWRDCEALWISGDEIERFISAPELAELGLPVTEPPFGEHARRPRINLLPLPLRPRRPSRGQLVTVAMFGLTVLLGLGFLGAQVWQRERYVRQLSQEIGRLDPEAKAVERLSAEVGQRKRLLAALRGVEARGLHALPFLRDLTELLPQDAWLQSLNLDGQGVELIGQAGAASALIPTLEASPWLERVEFTSPVTKGQGKEQFRLHASWEKPPHPAGGTAR